MAVAYCQLPVLLVILISYITYQASSDSATSIALPQIHVGSTSFGKAQRTFVYPLNRNPTIRPTAFRSRLGLRSRFCRTKQGLQFACVERLTDGAILLANTNWTALPCDLFKDLAQDGDVEINPGPVTSKRHFKFPCGSCYKPVKSNQKGVFCDFCEQWFHASCASIRPRIYESLIAEDTWSCINCAFHDLDLNSDTDEEKDNFVPNTIPRVLNLHSSNPNLMKGILGPLSRGHHQFGVVNAVLRSNSQVGSLAPSGSFFIRRMLKLGLVTYPKKCLPFTCDVSRSRSFSSITRKIQPVELPSSQSMFRKTGLFICDVSPKPCMFSSIPEEPQVLGSLDIPDLTTPSTSRRPDPAQESLMYSLKKHIRNKDVQRVEETVKQLDEIGCYDSRMYSLLMNFYCNEGNLEKTIYYKRLLHSYYPTIQIFDDVLLNIAALLASKGQFDEAEKLVWEHPPKRTIEEDRGMSKNAVRLLNFMGTSGDGKRIRQMLDLLMKNGYYSQNPSNLHVSTLVKFHLENNDIDSAVQEFLDAVDKYRRTPCQALVFAALIEKSEIDKLNKVMNASGKVHGQENAIINLIQAYLHLNRFKQAFSLLETSGVTITERKLYDILSDLVYLRKIDVLEELVKVKKDTLGANRDLLYYHLIRAYELEKNVEKALEAWSNMQKEGLEPSQYTLHLLGNFLTQMGHPVSFSFPESIGNYTFTDGSGQVDRMERINLSQNYKYPSEKISQVKRMSDQMEVFLNEDRLTDAKKVCDDLISGNLHPSLRVLKKYSQKLSDIGDINTLSSLEQQLPARVIRDYKLYNYKKMDKNNEVERTNWRRNDKDSKFSQVNRMSEQMDNLLNEDRLTDVKILCDDLISGKMWPTVPVMKKYLQKLADIADIDALSSLDQQLPENVSRKCSMAKWKALAKVNFGLSEEVIKEWEENPLRYGDFFPLKALMAILDKHPENLDRLKLVADTCYKAGNPGARNMVWMWLLKNMRLDEAKKVFQSTPEFKKRLLLGEIVENIKKEKNIALSQALLDQVKTIDLRNNIKGMIYSCHIDLLVSVSKLDEALSTFKESQESIILSDLQRSTLELLESELTNKGLPVPFSLPKMYDRHGSNQLPSYRRPSR